MNNREARRAFIQMCLTEWELTSLREIIDTVRLLETTDYEIHDAATFVD